MNNLTYEEAHKRLEGLSEFLDYDIREAIQSLDTLAASAERTKDPYGIPNVCFTQITPEDPKRWAEAVEERIAQGFDYSEMWNLCGTISKFIIPRLKYFIEVLPGIHPSEFDSSKEFKEKVLNKILKGFEESVKDPYLDDTRDDKAIEEGLELFTKYYFSLWM